MKFSCTQEAREAFTETSKSRLYASSKKALASGSVGVGVLTVLTPRRLRLGSWAKAKHASAAHATTPRARFTCLLMLPPFAFASRRAAKPSVRARFHRGPRPRA